MSSMFVENRQRFFRTLEPNSLAIFFSAPTPRTGCERRFPFCQDPNFFYLSGFQEPNATLILHKEANENTRTILFCQPHDPTLAQWGESSIGPEQAKQALGFEETYALNLVPTLLPELLREAHWVYSAFGSQPSEGTPLFSALATLYAACQKHGAYPKISLKDWRPRLAELRLIKSDQELACMRKAAQITCAAHTQAMRAAQAQLLESDLEAVLYYTFARLGARLPAYAAIVASGVRGRILHYTVNDQPLKDGEMVLIDAGGAYQGYAADVTRTFPVNGTFTSAQRQVYNLVLSAQTAASALVRPDGSFAQMEQAALRVLVVGLIELGVLKGTVDRLIAQKAYKPFYMHSIGHWLGLEVHDVGNYGENKGRPFQPGMVLTVEPGLYLPDDKRVPESFRGMSVRIEDNFLVTQHGYENLTAGLQKTPALIQKCMEASSPFPSNWMLSSQESQESGAEKC